MSIYNNMFNLLTSLAEVKIHTVKILFGIQPKSLFHLKRPSS